MAEREQKFFGKEQASEHRALVPERSLTAAEKARALESIRRFFRALSSEMREAGVPLNERGRIDMDSFEDVYGKKTIDANRQDIERLKEIFQRGRISDAESRGFLPGLKEQALKTEEYGEACEMLIAAVLQKNLGKKFAVLRSSEYDDIKNGSDTIILDAKTGTIVCALDEIGRAEGARYEDKKQNILQKNLSKGGGFLKYGLSFEKTSPKPKLRKGAIGNIPLFYYALTKEGANAAFRQFQLSWEVSPAEKELFERFLDSVGEQSDLLLKKEQLNPKLKERLELFKQSVLK